MNPLHAFSAPNQPSPRHADTRPVWRMALALLGLCLLGLALGTAVGSTGWDAGWLAGWGRAWPLAADEVSAQIVWDIRLPRSLGACAAGALLGLAGAVAQGLFRNPLADPYLLGSASGASLGVAVALVLFGVNPFATEWLVRMGLTGAAFVGAVLAVLLTLLLARGVQHTLRLLLAGVIVGVVLGALASLVTLMRPDVLLGMQGFLLGSTSFIAWSACGVMWAVFALALLVAMGAGRVLDALTLGEATARSLGLPLAAVRAALIAVLALATGAAVAQTGLVAFVGLAAPHLVRSALHTTYRHAVLLSGLMGAALLLFADLLARGVLAPQELPVGVLTAVLGGVYLLWLMSRGRGAGAWQ